MYVLFSLLCLEDPIEVLVFPFLFFTARTDMGWRGDNMGKT